MLNRIGVHTDPGWHLFVPQQPNYPLVGAVLVMVEPRVGSQRRAVVLGVQVTLSTPAERARSIEFVTERKWEMFVDPAVCDVTAGLVWVARSVAGVVQPLDKNVFQICFDVSRLF